MARNPANPGAKEELDVSEISLVTINLVGIRKYTIADLGKMLAHIGMTLAESKGRGEETLEPTLDAGLMIYSPDGGSMPVTLEVREFAGDAAHRLSIIADKEETGDHGKPL